MTEYAQAIQHLLSSNLLSLKIISNYRSFVSLNASFQVQQLPQTEQQMRELQNDIISDQKTQMQSLQKVIQYVASLSPTQNAFQGQLSNLSDELSALQQDQASNNLISSQVMQYTLKTQPLIPDAISLLLTQTQVKNDNGAAITEVQQLQKTLLEEQQANIELQNQLNYLKVMKDERPQMTANQRIQQLESENQLLQQNMQDLRKSLDQAQLEARNGKEILQILQDSLRQEQKAKEELKCDNTRLRKCIAENGCEGNEQVIHAIGIIAQQMTGKQFEQTLNGALQAVNEMLAGSQAERQQLEQLRQQNGELQQQLITKARESEILQQQLQAVSTQQSSQIDQVTSEVTAQMLDMRAQLDQKDIIIQQLQSQQPGNSDQQVQLLKQNFKQAISELRKQILSVYEAVQLEPVKGQEFDLQPMVQRCQQLMQSANGQKQEVAKLEAGETEIIEK